MTPFAIGSTKVRLEWRFCGLESREDVPVVFVLV